MEVPCGTNELRHSAQRLRRDALQLLEFVAFKPVEKHLVQCWFVAFPILESSSMCNPEAARLNTLLCFLHPAYSMICLCCDASLYQFVRTSFFVCFVVKLGYHFGESGNASLCRDSNKLSWLHSNMWTNMLGSFSITVLIVNLFTDASVILISFFFASEPWDLEDLNLSVSWRSKYTRWIIFHGKLLPVIMCTRFLLCGF